MFKSIHRLGSRIRHITFLEKQQWLWKTVEPLWQKVFGRLSAAEGYPARVNNDVFRLVYDYGSRYDRHNKQNYEPVVYQALIDSVKEGMTVCDIGAHVGLLTLTAAKLVGPKGHVFAFEPAPETLATLKRHIRFNGYQDRAEAIDAVVSDTDGVVPFYVYRESMAASLGRDNVDVLNPELRSDPHLRAVEVTGRSVTLDQFCRHRNVEPDILKIDVEGAELRVLRGGRDLLCRKHIVILCEVHPKQMENCGSTLAEFEAFLQGVGYTSEALDAPNPEGIYHSRITALT